ncbi:hypothetical protein CBER1_01861 [Cercospora berteroae]|uniref:Deacetylase sirtuin-type domain-containing protein n=1 Tax=Cercospora berteroae TaxID=357750 RepID=A0A2S6CA06_9PEZI|nr:hypothetical protein CBER1_01861 [Cercospora berteroae]
MVEEIIVEDGVAKGVRGKVLEPCDDVERGAETSRTVVDEFELAGRAVVVATGGIGGNVEEVKKNWPMDRLGPKAPESVVVGVPAHVDGKMVKIAGSQGASVINMDRMWHYTEGLQNWNSIWPLHGIRIIPGPSSLWFDANGKRMPPFLFPGSDTLATLKHICSTGHDYSFFILDRSIIAREFALSGSEQNEDITSKSYWRTSYRYFTTLGTKEVQAFQKNGKDFVVANDLESLVDGMNRLAKERNGPVLDYADIKRQIELRDMQLDNQYTKDAQIMTINNARKTMADSLRIAPQHKILGNKSAGPLIAVRLNILTRKSLGGLETNLQGQVLRPDGKVFEGLYATGEAAGFGGGGVHGYSALEGTFLGGCIFTGKVKPRRTMSAISTDMSSLIEYLRESEYIVALVGAGLSASSGIPTFRGQGSLWHGHEITSVASRSALVRDPLLVWQFYEERRQNAANAKPNAGHFALARLAETKGEFLAITQNIDGIVDLSQRAGHDSTKLAPIHGSLFTAKCLDPECGFEIWNNRTSPLTPALDSSQTAAQTTPEVYSAILPTCGKCRQNFLRPGVVWFGEQLPLELLDRVDEWLEDLPRLDLFLVIGTSSRVFPAATYIEKAREKGARVAHFNVEPDEDFMDEDDWFVQGDAAITLPQVINPALEDDLTSSA